MKRKLRTKYPWLVTLLDLMLLMLTFFIMLYSISTPTDKKAIEEKEVQIQHSYSQRIVNLNYLEQILSQQISSFDGYKIKRFKEVLSIQIPDDIFTDHNKKLLSASDFSRIKKIGSMLSNISNDIFLQISTKNTSLQEVALQAFIIANTMKKGGFENPPKIIYQDNPNNNFIQIVILEQIRIKP